MSRGETDRAMTPEETADLRAALRDSTRRLGELEELARVGSWEWDVVADVVTWSDQLYRIFGVKPDDFEATYEDYLSRLHPDDRTLAEHNVERALRFHEPYAADYRVVWPDGEVRWLHCRGRAGAANDGTVVRLIGTSQDITERKQLEERRGHSCHRWPHSRGGTSQRRHRYVRGQAAGRSHDLVGGPRHSTDVTARDRLNATGTVVGSMD